MSIQEAAQAAGQVFPNTTVSTSQGPLSLRVVMVAIAGAESSWNATEPGDPGYDPKYGLCNGYSSWGLWQIHNVHAAYLTAQSGSSTPCGWANWLFNPLNNAKAAYSIYRSQGLNAWTTWQTGAWEPYRAQAQTAVQQVEASPVPPPTNSTTPPPSPVALVLSLPPPVLGLGLAVVGGGIVLGYLALSPARWQRTVAEVRRAEREAAQVLAQPL